MRRLPVVPERNRDNESEADVQNELRRDHAIRVPGWQLEEAREIEKSDRA
jgi:hypothetical protein